MWLVVLFVISVVLPIISIAWTYYPFTCKQFLYDLFPWMEE